MFLIESVNLTPRERDIVIKTELEGFSTTDIQDIYNIAFTTVVKTKKKAMLKIYKYISQDNNDTLSL
jgi:DNA-directed RNA polymerase specialized sigma24 family protein